MEKRLKKRMVKNYKNKIKNELKKIKMDKVYPIFFQVLKSLGVKHPSEGKQI